MKKILVTLGPASLKKEIVENLTLLGVYLFRINLSHTPLDLVEKNIKMIQSWTNVPICLDSEGAQLRNGNMFTENVEFKLGQKVLISNDNIIGDENKISFNPSSIINQFSIGDKIQIDFNNVSLEIIEKIDDCFYAIVSSGGTIGSNKAADVNKDLEFEPLTDKDIKSIKIGLDNGVKNFAMSFANKPEDVDLMRSLCGKDSNIICKIESPLGVKNLEGIIERTDAILIDRGDLSRRIPITLIPFLQRKIISTSCFMKKPVFVATNLLETMVTNKQPTRAESNDIFSTLEMGSNGLVLAAETAIGKFPLKCVDFLKESIKVFKSKKLYKIKNEKFF